MPSHDIAIEDSLGDIVAPGDVIAGKYRVERVIGTGGMGVVVEAWHVHFEERVAIKFLFPQMGANEEALGRFEREARAAFKIKSEHVARVIDVGKLDGKAPYMVMEYLEGADVADRLTDREPFVIEEAVDYVLQAVEAVAEAHALGIVHRDLKPENLFITRRPDGSPCIKVLDFGLSKMADDPQTDQRQRALTRNQQVMGTPQYMSPEQWMGAKHVGAASDQWALGIILYELLTGHQPFNQEHIAQLCTAVLRAEPPPVQALRPEVPSDLVAIIDRCLQKQPEDRYRNVGELALALHPFGSPAARDSARRVVGVFKRIGADPGEVPASSKGGLGHGMVLGAGAARSAQTKPRIRPERPAVPKADESTLVQPAPEQEVGDDQAPTHVYEASAVPMSDEVRARLEESLRDEDSTTGEMPLPRAPAPSAPTPFAPPGTGVADASAPHPAPPVDPSRYSHPGPLPPAPPSGPGLAAPPSGTGPHLPSTARASLPGVAPVAGAPARPRRTATATAQSWQHMLDETPRDGRKKVLAVLAGVAVLAFVAIFLLISPGESVVDGETAASAAEGQERIEEPEELPEELPEETDETTEDAPEEATEGEAEGQDQGGDGKAPEAAASASASASAKKKLPVARPPVKHKGRRPSSIFDHR